MPAYVVWEEVRLAIEEGRLFSDADMQEAQRRVFGLGVFATIRVTAGEPDEATARIPVRVIVREGPFRTLRLGVGARADAIRNEARLIGDWTNRDFLGGMRKLTVHARGGVGVPSQRLRPSRATTSIWRRATGRSRGCAASSSSRASSGARR